MLPILLLPLCLDAAQFAELTVTADADTFVRSAAPTNNYGGAGAIAVSGSAAVNDSNQQNGRFDSLIRFPMSNLVATLDSTLGTHDWIILSTQLKLTEVGAPSSSLFNVGTGTFEARWSASDSWIEGTGTPALPTLNGVAWNDLPSLLNATLDVSLGRFTNSGIDGPLTFELGLSSRFVSDIRADGPVGFYLTAVSPQIGFTAKSRSNNITNEVPFFTLTAAINPNPRFDPIKRSGTNVILSFDTVSNWNYLVQSASSPSGAWSNLASFTPSPTNGYQTLTNVATGGPRFYRLMISP
jgi:hypothetical protein